MGKMQKSSNKGTLGTFDQPRKLNNNNSNYNSNYHRKMTYSYVR